MSKTIDLAVLDFKINIVLGDDGQSGTLASNLKGGGLSPGDDRDWDCAVDVIESLVLGHACAGIDVAAPPYLTGLATALEAVANNL